MLWSVSDEMQRFYMLQVRERVRIYMIGREAAPLIEVKRRVQDEGDLTDAALLTGAREAASWGRKAKASAT